MLSRPGLWVYLSFRCLLSLATLPCFALCLSLQSSLCATLRNAAPVLLSSTVSRVNLLPSPPWGLGSGDLALSRGQDACAVCRLFQCSCVYLIHWPGFCTAQGQSVLRLIRDRYVGMQSSADTQSRGDARWEEPGSPRRTSAVSHTATKPL